MQKSILSVSPDRVLWGEQLPEMEKLFQYVEARNPARIGFDFMEYSFDYAYQYSLRKPGRTFQHIAVRNPSARFEPADFQPDLIIAERDEGKRFFYHGKYYKIGWEVSERRVYIPED